MFDFFRDRRVKYPGHSNAGPRVDLKQRFSDHNQGRNVSTATYRAWKLIF